MHHLSRGVIVGTGIAALTLVCLLVGSAVNSQPPEPKDAVPEPAPPTGQTYIGVKRCSSCHFKQYMSWKKTKHAKEAWESVPAKYRTSAECLACHATGYGEPTGFKDEASTPNLVGTTCEACHGPGSKHEEACKPFLNKKKLIAGRREDCPGLDLQGASPERLCRLPSSKGHKEHPKYDKE